MLNDKSWGYSHRRAKTREPAAAAVGHDHPGRVRCRRLCCAAVNNEVTSNELSCFLTIMKAEEPKPRGLMRQDLLGW